MHTIPIFNHQNPAKSAIKSAWPGQPFWGGPGLLRHRGGLTLREQEAGRCQLLFGQLGAAPEERCVLRKRRRRTELQLPVQEQRGPPGGWVPQRELAVGQLRLREVFLGD